MVNIKEPRDPGAIPGPATRIIHIAIILDPRYNRRIHITVGLWLDL